MKTQSHDTVRFIEVDENSVGQRLDNFLMTQLKGVPKSHIYKIIRRGEVRINKGRTKNVYRLKLNDLVRVPPVKTDDRDTSIPAKWILSSFEERVLFEDDDLIVLNKPSGIAVHGGTANSHGVIEALRFLRPNERYLELVHRLDKATSGCLLIAKNRKMLNGLQTLLRNRKINKTYTALLCGVIHKQVVKVNAPLEKRTLESGEHRVRVHPDGKKSETVFERLTQYKNATLVSASPKTGRTHQIRVHAKHLGHPIAGDERYSSPSQYKQYRENGLKRLFLHASKLSFIHPFNEERVSFEAPLDAELEKFIKTL
ncbi:MAG: RluA family pseudouridine synthase [Cycloclasticus sp.]|jgi:23S rRNA pseudouridine955/2504/2580 synthase|nr:RluA family pseudouridine synthase [Cycloclasticus sp.]MEE4291216.1 RluA family pseudouridine synthase [Cycloclasticus sp.]